MAVPEAGHVHQLRSKLLTGRPPHFDGESPRTLPAQPDHPLLDFRIACFAVLKVVDRVQASESTESPRRTWDWRIACEDSFRPSDTGGWGL
jgi:hypothetical protein